MTRETTRLSKDTTNAYARLRGEIANLDEEQIATRDAMYNQLLERRPEVALRQHVVVPAGSDSASAAALISPLSPSDPCALHLFWTLEPARQETILSDIRRVLENALEDAGHPEGLELRLDLGRAMEGLEPLLVELGWKRHGERKEFKTPVVELPTDWQGPLTWKSLDEVGLALAAAVLNRAGQGPDWEEEDDGKTLIESYLSSEELFCEPSCLEVGFDSAREPVAIVIAQTAPADGWCTMTFMGIVEEARGKGLGKWVHRRGFELLRQQGGESYHGGTSATNEAMLALFRAHGCKPYLHLSVWKYRK